LSLTEETRLPTKLWYKWKSFKMNIEGTSDGSAIGSLHEWTIYFSSINFLEEVKSFDFIV